jgi:Outer membrane protein beta-barrel domain/Domain of unknown function (DUF6265)
MTYGPTGCRSFVALIFYLLLKKAASCGVLLAPMRYLLLLVVTLLFSNAASAQVEDPEDSFRALRALDGVWFMPSDRGDRLEVWAIENDSTLQGKGMRIKAENGDTVLLETMILSLRDTNVIYSVKVRGQNTNKFVDFRLTADDEEGFLFENPQHDDPKKIRYLLLSNREIQVKTEGRRNGRVTTEEYVFEREFNPSSVEFRVRVAANVASLQKERDLNSVETGPDFGLRPGWELGVGTLFKGRGGFLSLNAELSLASRRSGVEAAFYADTLRYARSGTYNTLWVQAALFPEFTLRRDGRLSLIVGPYFGQLVYVNLRGDAAPESGSNAQPKKDFRRSDFGLLGGIQYRLPDRQRMLKGRVGVRFNYGLRDVDDLYRRRCNNGSTLCNERILLRSLAVFYSCDLRGF